MTRDTTYAIHVVRHGWHAGIVLRREDAPISLWPEQRDIPGTTYLEVGWGDAAYYREPDPGLGTLLKAALWPTRSTLHVAGFSGPVTDFFPDREIVRIDLPEADYLTLVAFIHDAYAHDPDGQPTALGPGLYGTSRFYRAEPRYHVLRNCNTWAARALREAGLPVSPVRSLTVGLLLRQVRAVGTVIQRED